ncbi:MAG: hypothetical protein WBK69_06090 [bacterium]
MEVEGRERPRTQVWLEACRKALVLTKKQGEAIAAGDYLRLDALLMERGRLLAELGDLREEGLASTLQGDERWGEVLQLLREIARLDEEHQAAITDELRSLRGDRKQVDKWRRAARAYGGGQEIPDRGVKA